jgi:hypothetical protein
VAAPQELGSKAAELAKILASYFRQNASNMSMDSRVDALASEEESDSELRLGTKVPQYYGRPPYQ